MYGVEIDHVSRETLGLYCEGIRAWNQRINLISASDLANLETRHIDDCLRVVRHLPQGANRVLDMGSGAGLPGLIVAIALRSVEVVLVESDSRKAAFLTAMRRKLGLDVTVLNERIEDTPSQAADVITARALAPLKTLLDLGFRHRTDGATFLFLKGRTWRQEVEEARSAWRFDLEVIDDRSDGSGPLLKLRDVEPIDG